MIWETGPHHLRIAAQPNHCPHLELPGTNIFLLLQEFKRTLRGKEGGGRELCEREILGLSLEGVLLGDRLAPSTLVAIAPSLSVITTPKGAATDRTIQRNEEWDRILRASTLANVQRAGKAYTPWFTAMASLFVTISCTPAGGLKMS